MEPPELEGNASPLPEELVQGGSPVRDPGLCVVGLAGRAELVMGNVMSVLAKWRHLVPCDIRACMCSGRRPTRRC